MLKANTLSPHPPLHCGHRSVFIDRLDVGVVGGGAAELGDFASQSGAYNTTDSRRLIPHATVIMHMRNRVYEPFTGRFMQRDMNVTGSVVADANRGACNSQPSPSSVDAIGLYGDGGSLFAYLASRPRGNRDPLGLTDMMQLTVTMPAQAGRTLGSATPLAGMVSAGGGYASGAIGGTGSLATGSGYAAVGSTLGMSSLATGSLGTGYLGKAVVALMIGSLIAGPAVLTVNEMLGSISGGSSYLRPYGGPGGGHHCPAKSLFRGLPGADENKMPAMPNEMLDSLGIYHPAMTGAQQTGYRALANLGKAIDWDSVEKVEVDAFVAGGLKRSEAEILVRQGIQMCKDLNLSPVNIPWGK